MRHRVMNMKKIELLGTRNLRHLHRERQSVIGGGEQRVMGNINSMEMQIVLWQVQPNGLSVTKKINLVTAAGQFRAERRCKDPTAANQRKARNPNFKRPRFHYTPV